AASLQAQGTFVLLLSKRERSRNILPPFSAGYQSWYLVERRACQCTSSGRERSARQLIRRMMVLYAAAMHGRSRSRSRRKRSRFRPAVLAALVCLLIAGSFTVSTAASIPTQQERDGTWPGALALHNQQFVRGGQRSQVEGDANGALPVARSESERLTAKVLNSAVEDDSQEEDGALWSWSRERSAWRHDRRNDFSDGAPQRELQVEYEERCEDWPCGDTSVNLEGPCYDGYEGETEPGLTRRLISSSSTFLGDCSDDTCCQPITYYCDSFVDASGTSLCPSGYSLTIDESVPCGIGELCDEATCCEEDARCEDWPCDDVSTNLEGSCYNYNYFGRRKLSSSSSTSLGECSEDTCCQPIDFTCDSFVDA
ncbi:unnamed protein product, partial [Ectocarpus sp. 13 AM-2016]